jgi:hypothetical protein
VTYALRFTSLLFVVLALIPAGAHLFSMVGKLRLSRAEYLAAQRAYDGWSLFGIVVFGALILLFALAVRLYRSGEPYALTVTAFLCIAGTQPFSGCSLFQPTGRRITGPFYRKVGRRSVYNGSTHTPQAQS